MNIKMIQIYVIYINRNYFRIYDNNIIKTKKEEVYDKEHFAQLLLLSEDKNKEAT